MYGLNTSSLISLYTKHSHTDLTRRDKNKQKKKAETKKNHFSVSDAAMILKFNQSQQNWSNYKYLCKAQSQLLAC